MAFTRNFILKTKPFLTSYIRQCALTIGLVDFGKLIITS
jgi:hypothetical protein